MTTKYTPKYGATRHRELLEEMRTRNQTIAEIADDLCQHAKTNVPALLLLKDIIMQAAANERSAYELLTLINSQ